MGSKVVEWEKLPQAKPGLASGKVCLRVRFVSVWQAILQIRHLFDPDGVARKVHWSEVPPSEGSWCGWEAGPFAT
jgi:hypothetical protein